MLRVALLIAIFVSADVRAAETTNPADPPSVDAAGPLAGEPRVPLGDVAGDHGGLVPVVPNPADARTGAINRGKQLFVRMNCAGCHGYDAKGGMGPDLTDRYWRYGGSPVAIYESIIEGRPQGMPSWSAAIPSEEVWDIVTYIESFGGASPAQDEHAQREGDEPGELTAPEVEGKP